MVHRLCIVCGCGEDEGEKMHHFPSNRVRCILWQEKMGMKVCGEVSPNWRICSKHFTSDCYRGAARFALARQAVPTLFPCHVAGSSNIREEQAGLLLAAEDIPTDAAEVLIGHEEGLTKQKDDGKISLPVDNTEAQNQYRLEQQEIIIIRQHNGKNNSNVSNPVQNVANDADAVKIYYRLCQICLQPKEETILSRLDDNKNCKYTETAMEMLKIAIPEFDENKYSNSEICSSCKDLVIASFELQLIWKATEAKLKDFADNSMIGKVDDVIHTPIKVELDENPFEGNTEEPIPIEDSDHETIKYNDHDYSKVGIPPKSRRKKAVYRPVLCEQCGITFLNNRRMVRHLKLYHLNLMCENCGEVFDSYITLNKHIRSKHGTAKSKLKKNRCNICTKVFANIHSLKTHILHVHLKKYNYTQCHICGKRLSDKNALRTHLRMHSPHHKPHRCEICNKSFYSLSLMKKHMRIHADTVYCCNICGKKVKHKHSLEQHIKIFHLGEGGCTCDICGRPYWKKFDLQRHKVRIHGWHPSHDKQRNS